MIKKSVKKIRILTGLQNDVDVINYKLLVKFRAYKEELQKDGISLEFKVVSTNDGNNKIAYDQYLLGDNVKFNVASFTALQQGRFSEIKKTENEIPFDQYWNDSHSYDLEKDWSIIKKLI